MTRLDLFRAGRLATSFAVVRLLVASLVVGAGTLGAGCGVETETVLPRCPDTLPVGSTCQAFCERVAVDCNIVDGGGACAQGCECDLLETEAISPECGAAQEAGFLCVSELQCIDVDDFFEKEPLDSFPCRDSVFDIMAACGSG